MRKPICIFIIFLLFAFSVQTGERIGFSDQIPLENGSVPVIISDPTNETVDIYVCNNTGTTTLTSAINAGDTALVAAGAAGATLYQAILLEEDGHAFQSIVTGISGTDITIGSGADYDYTTSAVVIFGDWNLALADGSSTPVVYSVQPRREPRRRQLNRKQAATWRSLSQVKRFLSIYRRLLTFTFFQTPKRLTFWYRIKT